MTAIQLVTWIFAPITLITFVLSFTFLMLRVDEKERLLVKQGLRDKEILEENNKTDKKSRKFLHVVGTLAEFPSARGFSLIYGFWGL